MSTIANSDAITAPHGSFRRLTRVKEPKSYMDILRLPDTSPAAGPDFDSPFYIILLGPWERDQIVDPTHCCGATVHKEVAKWCHDQGWKVQSYHLDVATLVGVENRCVQHADRLGFGEYIKQEVTQIAQEPRPIGMSMNLVLARYRSLDVPEMDNPSVGLILDKRQSEVTLRLSGPQENLQPNQLLPSNFWIVKCRKAPTHYAHRYDSGWCYTNDQFLVLKLARFMGRDFELYGLTFTRNAEVKAFVTTMDGLVFPFGEGLVYFAPKYAFKYHLYVVRSENAIHAIEGNNWDMTINHRGRPVEKKNRDGIPTV